MLGLDAGLEGGANLAFVLTHTAVHALLVVASGATEDSAVLLDIVTVGGMAGHLVASGVRDVTEADVLAAAFGAGTVDEVVIAERSCQRCVFLKIRGSGLHSLTTVLRSDDPLDVRVSDACWALDACR